ncbi:MAG: hypothetical protein Q9M09_00190 [Mariprofundaceae bacterium]|nr:hypothetical protein [Mariprofundaceae bacterium]
MLYPAELREREAVMDTVPTAANYSEQKHAVYIFLFSHGSCVITHRSYPKKMS